MKRRYMSKVVLYFTYYSIVSARQRDDGDFTGDLSKLSVPQCFPAPLLCFRWTAMLPAWHAVARILFQPQKNCFNGRNTVSMAGEILFQWQLWCFLHCFTVSLFPRLAGCTAGCTGGVSPAWKWHLLLALLPTIATASIRNEFAHYPYLEDCTQ